MTTAIATTETETVTKSNAWRPARHWRIAEAIKDQFTGLIPERVVVAALATCRITVQGPQSVGKGKGSKRGAKKDTNWALWIRTRLQTYGEPVEGYGVGQGDYAVGMRWNWKTFDCIQIVADLLDCVGVTMDDFWTRFGRPFENETFTVDLIDVIQELAGAIDSVETDAALVAVAGAA